MEKRKIMKKNFLIVSNPNSGNFIGKNKIIELKKFFVENNINTEIYFTEYKNSTIDFLKDKHRKYSTIIGVGGDGTLNEIAQLSKIREFKLGLIPSGTANVLAKEFSIPENNIFEAAKIILKNKFTVLDTFLANDIIFFLFLSGGIDSFEV